MKFGPAKRGASTGFNLTIIFQHRNEKVCLRDFIPVITQKPLQREIETFNICLSEQRVRTQSSY